MGKLAEIELKLAETASTLSTGDKEFTNYKRGEKARKQTYYNRGFRDAESLAGLVIFQARSLGLWKARWKQLMPSDSSKTPSSRISTEYLCLRTLLSKPKPKSKERTVVMKRRAPRVRSLGSCLDRSIPMWWCLMMNT